MKLGLSLSVGLLACAFTLPARAQTSAAAPAPGAKPVESASDAAAQPSLPTPDDPMLATPPAPQHMLTTWQEALKILRQNSTALKTARAQALQAEAQKRVALAPALPQLSGRAAATDHLLVGEGNAFSNNQIVSVDLPRPPFQWSAALTLTVPVLASRAWYDYGTAKSAIEGANLTAKDVERQQVALLAAAIVSVVTNERLVEVSRIALVSGLSNLDLTKRRAALGAASSVDVLRIEQEVSRLARSGRRRGRGAAPRPRGAR
ncbi:MAG: TolC family protein [Polyangiaceae bacterium]